VPIETPLDFLPIWAVYLVTVLLAVGAAELGFRLGRYWQRRTPEKEESVAGAMVGATLALLAFLLAFLISVATDRFDNRRRLVVEDASSIRTAYLRAGYIPEPYGTESRQLLREYVDLRLAAVEPGKFAQARARSEEIHNELWSRAELIADPGSDPISLYIDAVNEIINVHTQRVVAATLRIPTTIWFVLYFGMMLSMLMVGFDNGLQGTRSIIVLVALVLVFSAVMLLMVDLDRPQEGFLTVSQQPMIDLQKQVQGAVP
jgi:hypothetical protein